LRFVVRNKISCEKKAKLIKTLKSFAVLELGVEQHIGRNKFELLARSMWVRFQDIATQVLTDDHCVSVSFCDFMAISSSGIYFGTVKIEAFHLHESVLLQQFILFFQKFGQRSLKNLFLSASPTFHLLVVFL
jgi:hypothetical protein